MNQIIFWSFFTLFVPLGLTFFIIFRRYALREAAYKLALEANQKRLDFQTARINILTRALPTLQSMIQNPVQSDDWKTHCLDEARAMLRAEHASYWTFQEKEQKWNIQLTRGKELQGMPYEQGLGDLKETAKKRTTILATNESSSFLYVPLQVQTDVIGVFRFERFGSDKMTQRDGDLVSLFVNQLALTHENHEMVKNREKFYLELVQSLADTLDSRDSTTQGQTRHARNLARGIARAMDLPEEFSYYLQFAALLHDIGNIAIDESLLKKPGKLTADEFAVIKKHPQLGHNIIAPVSILAPVAPMILYHQERFDGTGYPEGLRGEEIPLGARIVALLDAWIAMTTPKAWRKALKRDDAIKEIKKGAGTQFDPAVVDAFLSVIQTHGSEIEAVLQ